MVSWASFSFDDWNTCHADGWGIEYSQPVTMPSVTMSIPFLTLPRELRDVIYRYLLSINYTKHLFGRFPRIYSIKQQEYTYILHPSIILTCRQIEKEASYILYTENNLIRVSSGTLRYSEDIFGWGAYCEGHPVPLLARGAQAERFTRHTMDIVILYENMQQEINWMDIAENCFVIAGDDLPELCHTMLVQNIVSTSPLEDLTLAIEIYPEDTADPVVQFEGDETLKDGGGILRDNVLTENTATRNENGFHGRAASKEKASSEEAAIARKQAIVLARQRTSTFPSPRIQRLLEPLNMLHSLHSVYIEGGMSDDYKAALLVRMLSPPPGDLEVFDLLHGMFEDTMCIYNTSTRDAAITKMISTLEAINDQNKIRPRSWRGSTVIPKGPYVGCTVRDAQEDMQYQVRTNLARAFLDNGDVDAAQDYVRLITGEPDMDGGYRNSPPMGHKAAVAFHFEAHLYDIQGDRERRSRTRCLGDIVNALQEGLRHEPGNPTLERELEERQDELDLVREMEKVMGMWACYDELEADELDTDVLRLRLLPQW